MMVSIGFFLFADTENTHTPMDPEDEALAGTWMWEGKYRGPGEIHTIMLMSDMIFSGYDKDGNYACTGFWDASGTKGPETLELKYLDIAGSTNLSDYTEEYSITPVSNKNGYTLTLESIKNGGPGAADRIHTTIYLSPPDM